MSITAERARFARFSQPYFESNLSILSRTEDLSPWDRIKPFFNMSFYYAVGFLLLVLAIVGTLIWLAERGGPDSQFPNHPVKGIANGIWFAVVTMSTVGYGDLAPRTRVGRLVAGIWIILSVITASSLVAGIASTLTLTGLKTSVISTAQDLAGKSVAVLANSPAETFVQDHGARIREVDSLRNAYQLLLRRTVDSVMVGREQRVAVGKGRHA